LDAKYEALLPISFIFFVNAAVPLSIDHKPDRSDERQRIEDAGGFVIWAGRFYIVGVQVLG